MTERTAARAIDGAFPIAAVCLVALTAVPAIAQSGSRGQDSLRTYRLSEIVIGDEVQPDRSMETVRRIPIAALVREDAASAAELVRLIPSAHLQTNSRGESLIYIRNAGERQVGVFFDGALLNVPWDYRIDMSLIPVGMLGGVSVSRGVPSVVYGTNVIGGAVNLQSRSLSGTGSHMEIGGQIGSERARRLQSTYLRKTRGWSVVASGSLHATDGQALPDDSELAFGQSDGAVRTNTDRRIGNFFVRLGRRFEGLTELGVSLLHIESEKGVAPEGHIDPAVDQVRYWRYPTWRNSMLIVNAASPLGPDGHLHAAFWGGRFGQHIEQYASIGFDRVTDLQKDGDYTFGMRMTGDVGLGAGRVRGALNWLMSTHRQTDTAFDATGLVDDRVAGRYRQMLFSAGSEYEVRVVERLDAVIGASIDGSATPVTGDKPERDPDLALGITTGLRKYLGRSSMLRLSAGRKVRFPTMRELFGEALNRFVLNADLNAESSLQSELAYEYSSDRLAGEIVAFYRRTFDTIDQEVIEIDGQRKRRRINLDGSRTWGMEVGGSARLTEFLSADGHLTWMDPRAFVDGETRTLNEKPELLASLTVRAVGAWGGSFQATLIHTGAASALALDNSQTRLPASSVVNLRVAFREFFSRGGLFVEFYAGVNNLLDAVSLPQQGLPGPGREFRLGAEISF